MADVERRPIIMLSGGRTTWPLARPLYETHDVAIYDPNAISFFKEKLDRIICPAKGATAQMHAHAFNESTVIAARIIQAQDRLQDTISRGARMVLPNGTSPAHVSEWLPGMSTSHMAACIMNVAVMDAFCDQFDLMAVVVHEDVTPTARALVLWANDRGIPSIHVPHANHFLRQGIPDVHERCYTDYIAATSSWMCDWYAARGYPEENIRVTGCPNWDRWTEVMLTKQEARDVLRVPQDKTVVTYCTSWPQNTNWADDHDIWDRAHDAVVQAAAEQGWTLIWSQHPGSPGEWRQAFAARMKQAGLEDGVIVRGHLDLTVKASDCFIAVGPSNVLIEAAMGGTPSATVEMEHYGFPDAPPWPCRAEAADVTRAVNAAMDNWNSDVRDAFVTHYACADDGKAVERTVALIREVALDHEVFDAW